MLELITDFIPIIPASASRKRGSVEAALSGANVARSAHVLAQRMRRRVFEEGKPVDLVTPYPADKRKRLISPRYPVQGYKVSDTEAWVFEDSAEFHRAMGTRLGTFFVSGGLARGMSVVTRRSGASIRFMGRSEGQGMANRSRNGEPHFREMADGRVMARPRKVSNALKAATVLKSQKVNLLKPTVGEIQSVGEAFVLATLAAIPEVGGAKAEWAPPRVSSLARAMHMAMR